MPPMKKKEQEESSGADMANRNHAVQEKRTEAEHEPSQAVKKLFNSLVPLSR